MKIKFLLILCFSFVFLLIGCNKEYYDLEQISQETIFEQKEEEYFVFMHKSNCPGCETVLPEVMKYNTKVIDNKIDTPRVYGLDVDPEGKDDLLIYRIYRGENGQGTDGKFYVDNTTKWGELYIASTPSLIKIKNIDGVKTAFYVAQGASNITKYLKGLE